MLTVEMSQGLLEHLKSHTVHGKTVASCFFEGGRLWYPGRMDLEQFAGAAEPYTIEHEARVLMGDMPRDSILHLADYATFCVESGMYGDLEILWASHRAYCVSQEGPSLDRLVAALVAVENISHGLWRTSIDIFRRSAEELIIWMHSIGLPPTQAGLEELFDGAFPACVGLGMVDI